MCCPKVAHSRDSHVRKHLDGTSTRRPEEEEEEEEPSAMQRHAMSLLLSEYGQAREMSTMVSALTRVVAGDAASGPAPVAPEMPMKREREQEAVVPEEVLRYYRGFANQWWTGSRQPGEPSTSFAPAGEISLVLVFFCSVHTSHGSDVVSELSSIR